MSLQHAEHGPSSGAGKHPRERALVANSDLPVGEMRRIEQNGPGRASMSFNRLSDRLIHGRIGQRARRREEASDKKEERHLRRATAWRLA